MTVLIHHQMLVCLPLEEGDCLLVLASHATLTQVLLSS